MIVPTLVFVLTSNVSTELVRSRLIVRMAPGSTGLEVVPVNGLSASTARILLVDSPAAPLTEIVTTPGPRAANWPTEAPALAIVVSAEVKEGAGGPLKTFPAASL